MVSLTALWLPIVLSAVFVFIASSIIHMVLGFHNSDYKKLPDHQITRGVKPFAINDEWYYHMRFRPQMKGVTPLLTALPPKETDWPAMKESPSAGDTSVTVGAVLGAIVMPS